MSDGVEISNRAKKRLIGKTIQGLRREIDALRAANRACAEAIRKNKTLEDAILAELKSRGKSYA